jgi:ATP-binding cassette subfamily G (WHITE) protein 2 (SNQ2)
MSEASGTRTPIGPAVETAAHQLLPLTAPAIVTNGVDFQAPAPVTAVPLQGSHQSLDNNRRSMPASDTSTAVPSPDDREIPLGKKEHPTEEVDDTPYDAEEDGQYAPIRPARANGSPERPKLMTTASGRRITEEDLFRSLSRRRSSRPGDISHATTNEDDVAELQEIERLMSRMFGKTRQENSEEEKTRHVGVIWKNLTVKGMGLGAALQPSVGDIFLNLPRFLKNLITKGPRKAAGKPPVRTIIDDFSGCIRPGEMLLVLGRPGAGCSTFLKLLGNQRFGYEKVEGEMTYGGTDAKTMGKKYRGEIIYNPEDDLHYATLKVKQTLKFALRTRTPGKESRNEGETKQQYVNEFLRVVSKLFWIEHTMDTKVGNEFIRGVSGGERKRVSGITKYSKIKSISDVCIGLDRRSHDHESQHTSMG